MRHLLPIALALALPACATTGSMGIPMHLSTTVQRASEAWTVIKATAGLWMPRLSPERQAQVQHAIAIGDQAILTAQTAATVAEATAALGQVNVAAGEVTAATR